MFACVFSPAAGPRGNVNIIAGVAGRGGAAVASINLRAVPIATHSVLRSLSSTERVLWTKVLAAGLCIVDEGRAQLLANTKLAIKVATTGNRALANEISTCLSLQGSGE